MKKFSSLLLAAAAALLFIAVVALSSSSNNFVAAQQEGGDAAGSEADTYETNFIRCAVCRRAIAYIWHEGAKLRAHCKSEERNDPRCDFGNVHHFGIEEMTQNVCDKLPKTHAAIEGSEFDLVLHDDPKHTKENADKIMFTCKKYVHDDKGIDNVALYMFANLDAGKSTGTILHSLQHRFCKDACNKEYKLARHVEDPSMPDARYLDGRYREGDL